MNRRKWWQTATIAARAVQVRGAIDIGLTRKEAAILLGTTRQTLSDFAKDQGIHFEGPSVRIARPASLDEFEHHGDGVQALDRQLSRVHA
jgi:hypothetical protein